MKPFFPCLLLGLAFHASSMAEEAASFVRFSNHDVLSGSLDSLTSDLLVWKSPDLEKPTPFFLKNVIDLSLPADFPLNEADHEATLTLTNGDVVRGQLAAVTDDTVSLDTWFAGRVNFNRLMVSGLSIEAKSTMLYRGPTGMEGWIQPSGAKPAWTYARGAFTSQGSGGIGREDLLPEECSVSFDMAKRSDSFSLTVIVLSNNATTDNPSSGYEISFQRGNITVRTGKNPTILGNAHSQALAEDDKVRIEIRASSKSGKVCLYVNDRVVEVWTDPEFAKGTFGKGLHFVSGNTLPLRVSAIGVAPWDGVVPNPEPRVGMIRQFGFQGFRGPMTPPVQEKPSESRMELANGDSLDGEVTSIQEGLIAVKSSLGEFKIPVARFRSLALKKVDLERCIRRNGDVRASLPDGSSMVFKLDEVADGTLKGSSQNFGTATFKIGAFSRIEFNIYDADFENRRGGDDW